MIFLLGTRFLNARYTCSLLALVLFATSVSSLVAQEATDKQAIPDEVAQAKSTKLINEVYGSDFAKAKTPTEKRALATKLFEKASQTVDDPESQYVMLRLALDYSTQSSDMQQAFRVVDLIVEKFKVDFIQLKAAVLSELVNTNKNQSLRKPHAEEVIKLLDHAVRHGELIVAASLANLALSEAQKARDKDLVALAKNRITEVAELNKAIEEARAARIVYEGNPADPEANFVVGRYLCFVEDDWEKGLSMLAIGSDEDLTIVAKQELQGAVSPQEQVQLGDAWWELAEKHDGWTSKEMQIRAGHWYQMALPRLSGITSDRASMRVEQVIQLGASPTELNGKWLLVFRSADPAVWNTDSRDANRFAIPLATVPDDIKYLKMQLDPKTYVVIPMSKTKIGTLSSDARYGWEGSNQIVWGGRQLGIFDRSIIIGQQGYEGGPCIWWENGGFSGFGFGYAAGNVQGWGWDGKLLGPTTIEIYVTSESLSASERENLLK